MNKSDVRPHKIGYYLEKRDPDFETKMTQVLHLYKQVGLIKEIIESDYEYKRHGTDSLLAGIDRLVSLERQFNSFTPAKRFS